MKRIKQRVRDMKIKYQFCLLVLLVLVIVVSIQFQYVRACLDYAYRQSTSYFDSLAGQIAGEINTRLTEVRNTATRIAYSENIQKYLTTRDDSQRLTLSTAAKDVIRFGLAGNLAIQSVRVYQTPSSYLGYSVNDINLIIGDVFTRFDLEIGSPFDPFFSEAFTSRYAPGSHFAYIMPVYDIQTNDKSTRPIGVLFALCTTEAFSGLRNDSSFPDMGLSIFDKTTLLSHNGVEPPQALIDAVISGDAAQRRSQADTPDGPLLIRITPLPGTSFRLCCAFPRAVLTDGIQPMVVKSLLFTLCGILLIVGISLVILSNLVKPIERMTAEMEQIGGGSRSTRLTRYAGNEVGVIASTINSMLAQLDDMHRKVLKGQERLYSMELTRVESELQYLHSQINPHFLYNSLECIRSIALVNGQNDIVTMSVSLSRILRYSIQSDQTVKLSREISLAQDFFSVINIRNRNIHKLKLTVDDALGDALVIKMLLQPLIENCFHAFEDCDGGRVVCVFAQRDGDSLRIRVLDNGRGMSRAACARLNERLRAWSLAKDDRIGLANIQKRVQLTYGDAYGVRVLSRERFGTCVTIRLPLVSEVGA